MNTETDALKAIAEEIAARAKEANKQITKPDNYLVTEVKRLEKAITDNLIGIENFTQRDSYHYNTLSKLVNICDLLYDVTDSVNPNVQVLLDLLSALGQVIPTELRPNLKLPKGFVAMRKDDIAESWLHHSSLMAKHGVPEKLMIHIAAIPFKRFTEAKFPLFRGDFVWLKDYQAKLEILDWENADCNSPAEALLSLLIGRDFNDDRFFIYCKKYITERLKKITGKRNRVLEYAQCEKLVMEDTQNGVQPFDGRANSVSTRLVKWIGEEIDFVETHEREVAASKFEFKWNVETIAFFFKLLYDHKALGKVTLEKLSEQIAANCSSVGREELTAGSVFSKFYVKEEEVTVSMEKLLAAMLADVRQFLR
jgi:hypothetical protein